MLSAQVCREFMIIPIAYRDGTVTVATSDPFDDLAHDTAERLTGARVEFAVAPRWEITDAIDRVLAPAPTGVRTPARTRRTRSPTSKAPSGCPPTSRGRRPAWASCWSRAG